MSKKKSEETELLPEVEVATEEVIDSGREKRWEEFLERAKIQNPVKFAEKEARGEFSKIPESFK